jgi:hypothetical protein
MNAMLFMRATRWTALAHAVLYWTVTLCLLAAAIGAAVAGVGLKHYCVL